MISESTKVALEIAKVALDKAVIHHMLSNPSLVDIRYYHLPEQEIYNTELNMIKELLHNVDVLLQNPR